MSGWHSLSGLLYSKPTGAFSRFKSKRPQYYVFEESKCQLHFYKDKHEAAQKDKEPLGTINVRGASITLHFEEPNSFVINSDSKEFILQAENHESMMIWLLALQANRDAFASRELKPENSRMSKQLALAHKRRESAPDVSGSFNGSSSLGSIPGRMPAGGAAAGGRRMPRMSTLDQTSSMMTRSAIEEEDEITKDWVDCEFLPEVAGAVGLPSSPPSPEPLTGKCAAAVKSFFVNTVEAAMNY
uniref:PH domain-containing protein n=1 Tax=Macrostomum lignano TaxID=282301 RepID=A0A1I8IWG7_9PLAT